ncbi:DUF3501 family protein [Siccirubricoccus sp. G192]|uniref:DUF3501 family protein n=1 Tax=Siccirubricoccus sp. G192 TaxID=2849651 RepID=UPI0020C56B75|nr:DUF3501 family protein [Siccirubricoccus sp. G192]
MANRHQITAAEILPRAEYAKIRAEERRRMAALKRNRRVEIGPFVTFHFESHDTMRHQVQEMCWIENGGAEQIPEELAAYNPLVPQGAELVATFMIEIDDPVRRKRILGGLGGIEETAFLRLFDETVTAHPEADQDRTTEEGKASSVQFVHFPPYPGPDRPVPHPGRRGGARPRAPGITAIWRCCRRRCGRNWRATWTDAGPVSTIDAADQNAKNYSLEQAKRKPHIPGAAAQPAPRGPGFGPFTEPLHSRDGSAC